MRKMDEFEIKINHHWHYHEANDIVRVVELTGLANEFWLYLDRLTIQSIF
jgi:transposase-like protein